MENQKDWMLSTLADYLRALGANLRVFAEVNGAMYPLLLAEQSTEGTRRVRGRLPVIADPARRHRTKKARGVSA
ncbi:MAG: hypothetical protein HY303_04065 [Candidatus Wallbacteria bacterium]|nr:hypothetical protein [Candidatus Wallbacteria bacterium]